MKSIKEGYKEREKRAKMLMDAIGAKHMTPNALAPLSNEEQQISAELAWNHHDYIMSLVSMGHEDLKDFVAKPECMLGFSDQVPVWVKKGSTKAVFAGHLTIWETSRCIGRERVPGGHWSNGSRSEGVILICWSTMMFIPNHPPTRTISLCHGSLQSKGGCIQYPSIRGIALLFHLAIIHTR